MLTSQGLRAGSQENFAFVSTSPQTSCLNACGPSEGGKQITLLVLPLLTLDEFVQNLVNSDAHLADRREACGKIKEQSWGS